MENLCTRGLFIGINRQKGNTNILKMPKADAERIRDYFAQFDDNNKSWELLVGTNKIPPRRNQVFTKIHQFISQIPKDQNAIIYFSGHAVSSEQGLIIKAFDTDEDSMVDTGIQLERILQILLEDKHNRKFCLILDCCREWGDETGSKILKNAGLPKNVCILYACAEGGKAIENGTSGFFTDSILRALEKIPTEHPSKSCSVKTLFERIRVKLYSWSPVNMDKFQLEGSVADDISFPLKVSIGKSSYRSSKINCTLRCSLTNEEELERAVIRFIFETLLWYRLPRFSPSARDFTNEMLEIGSKINKSEDLYKIRDDLPEYDMLITFPDEHTGLKSSNFICTIIKSLQGIPGVLTFKWDSPIDDSLLQYIGYSINSEWKDDGIEHIESKLTWKIDSKQRELIGVLVASPKKETREITIRCQQGDSNFSLDNLLPQLKSLVETLLVINL